MSTTKNGRIKKLIKAITALAATLEADRPKMPRQMNHTIVTRNKDSGEVTKNKTLVTVIDNTHGRNSRRKQELTRLEEALTSPGKKERMKKFAHKADSRAKKSQAKQESKQTKGKKKGG